MQGKIYIIPTPIGNLQDITLRALELLKTVDILLAEDTRHTAKLLTHFNISRKVFAYHQHNEHKTTKGWINKIKEGKSIGLVADAGTPGIADAGFLIVREAQNAQIEVECLPGATSIVPALVQSGLPCDTFVFEGFLPPKKGRQTKWQQLAKEKRTIVLFESPHRIKKALKEIKIHFSGETQIAVCREISKMHSETFRGTTQAAIEHFSGAVRGEFVLVIKREN